MEHIGCVYYINLDHRTDRKEEIEKELDTVGLLSKSIRIPGVYISELGILGCACAHINAIESFLKSEHTTCIILEDDFTFQIDKDYMEFLFNGVFTNKIGFDCILLGGNILEATQTEWPFLHKVQDAQTTSGYLLSKAFAPILLQNLYQSAYLLYDYYTKTGEKKHEYCLDIYLKQLQSQFHWFVINPKVGIQRESYSDNECKVTHYGV